MSKHDLKIVGERNKYFIPHVHCSVEEAFCIIEGESYLEDAADFYKRIFRWLDRYFEEREQHTFTFEIRLSYINTSSIKCLVMLMKRIQNWMEQGFDISIKWYYDEDDEDFVEDIKDFKRDLELPIEILSHNFHA